MEKKEIGKITHFFGGISVAAIKLTSTLKVGDKISIEGGATNFQQKVDSIQINKKNVQAANAKDEIGIKVKDKAREGDIVYKLEAKKSDDDNDEEDYKETAEDDEDDDWGSDGDDDEDIGGDDSSDE